MLKFNVRNQSLSRVDHFRPVEKSLNYLIASFSFLTDDWKGAEKKAVCKNLTTKAVYEAPLENDTCLIPWEALTHKGAFEISVRGTIGDRKFPTNAVSVYLGETLPDGEESNPPTPTQLERIWYSIGSLDNLETETKENLVAAINELVNKGIDEETVKQFVEDYLSGNPPKVEETDPTVSDWAKAPEKPSYSAEEVGALPADTKIPASTKDLTNDSGFITNAVSDLLNYYLKSETYTRDEVRELISAIPKFSISVVSSLPSQDISDTTIYLVSGGDGDDLYTEYIYVGGEWEILGAQRVDLTGYARETWVTDQLKGYQPVGDYALSSAIAPAVETALSEAKESGEFDGAPGPAGGYYTPVVTQPDGGTLQFDFTPSQDGMPAVEPVEMELPGGTGGVYYEQADEPEDAPEGALWWDTDAEDESGSGGIAVSGATVGQTVKIAAVDENGVPTAWEAVDFPSGGSEEVWEEIAKVTLAEDVGRIDISEDLNGQPFQLKKATVIMVLRGNTSGSTGWINLKITDGKTTCDMSGNLPSGFAYTEGKDLLYKWRAEIECRETETFATYALSQNNSSYTYKLNQFFVATSTFSGTQLSDIKEFKYICNGLSLGANTEIHIYGVRA